MRDSGSVLSRYFVALIVIVISTSLGSTAVQSQKRKSGSKAAASKKTTESAQPAAPESSTVESDAPDTEDAKEADGEQESASVKTAEYPVMAGQRINVRLERSLSSATSKVGDKFSATVVDPVVVKDSVVVIPANSVVTGKVKSVTPGATGNKAGELVMEFTSLELPNGQRIAIDASPTGKDDFSNTEKKSNDAPPNSASIPGGNVATDALANMVKGGGAAGAVMSTGVSTATSAVGNMIKQGTDVDLKSGAEMSLKLNESISLPAYVAP